MRAIVQDRYGPPDHLDCARSNGPWSATTRSWSGCGRRLCTPTSGTSSPAARSSCASWGRACAGRRIASRAPTWPGWWRRSARDVTRFQPGDEVFGESLRGFSWRNGGAYAEYAVGARGGPGAQAGQRDASSRQPRCRPPATSPCSTCRRPAAARAGGSWSTGPPAASAPSRVQLAKARRSARDRRRPHQQAGPGPVAWAPTRSSTTPRRTSPAANSATT